MALIRLSSIVSLKIAHTWQKSGSSLLYFSRRIPKDVKALAPSGSPYAGKKPHFRVSLQTSDPKVAAPKIRQLLKQTDEDWARLRNPSRRDIAQQAHELLVWGGVDPSDPQATPEALEAFFEFVDNQLPKAVNEDENITQGRHVDPHLSPVHAAALQMVQGRVKLTLEDCMEQYVAARPETEKDARMVFGYLSAFLGTRSPVPAKDRDLRSVKRSDVNEFVKWLLAGKHSREGKAVSTTTVSRYLTNLRAAFARAIRENELAAQNVFAQVEIPRVGKDVVKRETFTVDQYRHLHHALKCWDAKRGPDQLRCILALVAETGARLGEIVGLAAADVHLRATVPYLDLREHPWRSLKTLGSSRKVPLTTKALEAAKVALRLADHSPFLFPAYTMEDNCRADSASASLVKWVRTREGLIGTKLGNHSLRHGMEDLLRTVGCPDSARDQITGHKTPGMGAQYGEGYPLGHLAGWLTKAVALVHA